MKNPRWFYWIVVATLLGAWFWYELQVDDCLDSSGRWIADKATCGR